MVLMKKATSKALLVGGTLLVAHLIFRQYRKKEPTIYYVDNVPLGFHAATIPPFGIYIQNNQMNNVELMKHELVHWKQYQRLGLVRYYTNYIEGLIRNGYDLHAMEQEARANENEYCRVNYTECVRNGMAKTVINPNFRLWK